MFIKNPLLSNVALRGVVLLRWFVVLLMAFDQVGSPLHRHHHDSGVDAAHLSSLSSGASAIGLHNLRERDEPGSTIFHANTAMRSEERLFHGSNAKALDANRFVALIWPEAALSPIALCAAPQAAADDAAPAGRSWHELIPEGRAPPQRA